MEQISSLLAAAAVGGFAITAVAGKFMIPALHRLHFGQTIREEGPTWHSKKNGTPTMGGLCFILGILATLGIVWVMYSPKLPEVLGMPQLQAGMLVLFLAFGSGLIGFLDDFIKVVRHRNLGLTEAQKMILQIALTFGFMFGLHSLGLLTTQVQFPIFGLVDMGLLYYPIAFFGIIFLVNAVNLTAEQLNNILQKLLYEFPLREIAVSMPSWVTMLEPGHWLQSSVYQALLELAGSVHKMGDMTRGKPQLNCANTTGVTLTGMDLACGQVQLRVGIEPDIFFKILGEETGLPITDEASLLPCMLELAKAKAAYDKIKSALEQVQATGYGIVMPGIEELHLEEPEIVRQGGQYGVRLSASAPSLHLMRATIHTELSPTVGSEEQGETLIQGLLKDFESDPSKLWSTNIFGKSLNELVNEGLQAKLMHMPAEARTRLQQTLERIINDGCDGLICILL